MLDLSKIKYSEEARRQYVKALISDHEQQKSMAKALLDVLKDEKENRLVRATAAFILAEWQVKKAIPVLGEMIGSGLIPYSVKRIKYAYEPETALLTFKKQALPVLKKILSTAKEAEKINLITIMLFNITEDKEKVKKILKPIIEKRTPKDQRLFKATLLEMEGWKS